MYVCTNLLSSHFIIDKSLYCFGQFASYNSLQYGRNGINQNDFAPV